MSTTIEFDVQMTCESCVDKIENGLKGVDGVEKVAVSLEKGSVVVQTTLPSSVVQRRIEETGRRAVLKGYGGLIGNGGEGDSGGRQGGGGLAGVAMLGGTTGYGSGGGVQGVVRLVQAGPTVCVIDGTLDGLAPGPHGLHIHECGDISRGCDSIGGHFSLEETRHGGPLDKIRHTGDLGNIVADGDGRAVFRLEDDRVTVADVIGRSIAVTERADDLGRGESPASLVDGNSGRRLACGIISRSAGLFENSKRICACDGVTLWDERERRPPLAGTGAPPPTTATTTTTNNKRHSNL